MSSTATLLIELLTEELPPKALRALGDAFRDGLSGHLKKLGLLTPQSVINGYASPRRLAVSITQVKAQADDQPRREKLVPAAIGLNEKGEALPPLVKKLAALGLAPGENFALSELIHEHDGKQDQLWVDTIVPGADLTTGAQAALEAALATLPIPKVMRYQWSGDEIKFVRPAHGLVALHGSRHLELSALGLKAGRETLGHRFLSKAPIVLQSADDYATQLQEEGFVVAGFDTRRDRMLEALQTAAGGHQIVMPEALIDEVTSLVEWPVVLAGEFEERFLEVPQECLILTMQQNQKYFALTDAQGHLVNRFLLVSNLASKDPSVIIQGNERVLRARLSDAKFFFDQDRKRPLETRLADLAPVVYHNKIGSQAQRVERLCRLARAYASLVEAEPELAERAARLAKADLATDMVGEFPELQGLVGRRLAVHDGEPEALAWAIEDHYRPRFAGDALPANPLGLAVALADKLETLVGIWGIGLVPTGDKDPFALRRAALGVTRILIERRVPARLADLVEQAHAAFDGLESVAAQTNEILAFIRDRARGYLKELSHEGAAIEAVLSECPDRFDQLIDRLRAVAQFVQQPEAEALAAANKRIGNILRKAQESGQQPAISLSSDLLQEAAEKDLAAALADVSPKAFHHSSLGEYVEAMQVLASLKAPVDAFFDQVMVNADDAALRANRLALLRDCHLAMNQVADLSRLVV